jgi:hypothetical protein
MLQCPRMLSTDVLYQWMFSVRVPGCCVLEDVAFEDAAWPKFFLSDDVIFRGC